MNTPYQLTVLEAALCALEHLLTVTAFPYICGLGVSKFVGGLSVLEGQVPLLFLC